MSLYRPAQAFGDLPQLIHKLAEVGGSERLQSID
jgi:hypothetical protein